MLDSSTLGKPVVESPTQEAPSSSPSPVHDEKIFIDSDDSAASTDPVMGNTSATETNDSISGSLDTSKCYLGTCSGKVFASQRARYVHRSKVHPKKRFVCTLENCTVEGRRGLATRSNFEKHLKQIHTMSRGEARRVAAAGIPVPTTYNR